MMSFKKVNNLFKQQFKSFFIFLFTHRSFEFQTISKITPTYNNSYKYPITPLTVYFFLTNAFSSSFIIYTFMISIFNNIYIINHNINTHKTFERFIFPDYANGYFYVCDRYKWRGTGGRQLFYDITVRFYVYLC